MKEYDRKILANNLKALRTNSKLSQSSFAKVFHVSQQTVGAWETGRAIPGSDTLSALADYFNVSTDDLLGREQEFNDDEKVKTDLTFADLGMPYGGKIPDELKQTYADLAESYFKRHPEMLNKNNKQADYD